MNKSSPRITLLIVIGVALSGCAPSPSAESATTTLGTPSPSPTPTIDPGPVTLTPEDAAERYLSIVCPTNAAVDELNAAFDATEDDFLSGGAPDPATVKAAAQTTMESVRAQTELFDDEYYLWPDTVADEITVLRDFNIAALATLSTIVNAPDYETAYYAVWPDGTESQAAAQEVRYQLGLGADTAATCVDYRDAHAGLIAEKQAREAQLATQGE